MADFLTPAAPVGPAGQKVEWYGGDPSGGYDGQMGGTMSAGYSGGYSPNGKMGGGGNMNSAQYSSFDDEPPLLEELGIDIGAILLKVRGVLTFKMRHDYVTELDIGGPLLFVILLSSLHLLTGKLHFGVILGWSVVGSGAIYWVVNMLSGIDATAKIDFYNTCCLMGYGMIPLCIFSALDLVVPRGPVSAILAAVFVIWCTVVSTKMFLIHTPSLLDHRILVSYPCMLFYSAFMLLSFY